MVQKKPFILIYEFKFYQIDIFRYRAKRGWKPSKTFESNCRVGRLTIVSFRACLIRNLTILINRNPQPIPINMVDWNNNLHSGLNLGLPDFVICEVQYKLYPGLTSYKIGQSFRT